MHLTLAEKQAALETVLASQTFARCEQLRAFLRFVCDREMAGQAFELTEYLIGVQALGRPGPDRLAEGDLHAAFCGGSAGRAFRSRSNAATAEISVGRGMGGWVSGGVRCGVPGRPGCLRAPLISADSEVLLCIGTPLHLLVTPYLGKVPEGTPRYPAPGELYTLFSRFRYLPENARLQMQPVQKAVPISSAPWGLFQKRGSRPAVPWRSEQLWPAGMGLPPLLA